MRRNMLILLSRARQKAITHHSVLAPNAPLTAVFRFISCRLPACSDGTGFVRESIHVRPVWPVSIWLRNNVFRWESCRQNGLIWMIQTQHVAKSGRQFIVRKLQAVADAKVALGKSERLLCCRRIAGDSEFRSADLLTAEQIAYRFNSGVLVIRIGLKVKFHDFLPPSAAALLLPACR